MTLGSSVILSMLPRIKNILKDFQEEMQGD
jgi:hypothetical protein